MCAPLADKAARDLRDRAAECGTEDARGKAEGKFVAKSVGESTDRPVGRSAAKGEVMNRVNLAREMIERKGKRPVGERARSEHCQHQCGVIDTG